jgi:hypothetical protein
MQTLCELLRESLSDIIGGLVVAGVLAVIGTLYARYRRKKRLSSRNESVTGEFVQDAQELSNESVSEVLADDLDSEKWQSSTVASRLQQVLDLMNEGRRFDQIQVARLAHVMSLDTAKQLEDYFAERDEPNFEFLERFADCFGVNPNWMKFGEGSPYTSTEDQPLFPIKYYSRIEQLSPEKIVFVRNDSKYGESGVILELSEWKSIALPAYYHISSQVGGTGRSQIHSFYELIVKLKQTKYVTKCTGRIIDNKTFERLSLGTMYPGAILYLFTTISYWWDDFTNIHYRSFVAGNYRNVYGEEFLRAQEIVQRELEELSKATG